MKRQHETGDPMKLRTSAALFVVALTVGFSSSARADEWNKKTLITISGPIEVSGTVLQPGKYVLRTLDVGNMGAAAHVVQIMNENEDHLITTVMAINNYRLEPTGKTVLQFYEMPAGQPQVLRAWFYPGDNFGQEFLFKKNRASEISQVAHATVPTEEENTTATTTQPSNDVTPPPPAPEPAAVTAPEPAPQPAPQVASNQAPEPAPAPPVNNNTNTADNSSRAMPETASNLPLIGLIGLLSIGGALAVRVVPSRNN
jgi:hypothetical protein